MRFLSIIVSFVLALATEDADARLLFGTAGSGAAGGSTQNVATVSLTNENMVPNASASTVIGVLSATIVGGGNCSSCVFTMQTSGNSSDDGACAPQNNFQIINPGVSGPGTANLAVLNSAISGPKLLGGGFDTNGYPCVKATPTTGTSLIREFSILVRGPTFMAMAPYAVQYTSPAAPGTTLATLATITYNGTGSPSYALTGSAACTGLTISGNLVKVGGSAYSLTGFCGINVTQAGVQTSTGGSTYNAGIYLTQGTTYLGPGDLQSYQAWGGLRCFDAAVATGSQKSIRLIRDSDLVQQDINCLSNGDLDYASVETFCANSFCYVYHYYDQTGNGEDEQSWQEFQHAALPSALYVLKWLPPFIFNCNGSLACIRSQNSNDRLFQNTGFTGSSAAGTLTSVLLNPVSENQQMLVANCAGSASACPGLYAAVTTNAIGVGTATGGSVSLLSGPTTPGSLNTWYALEGGVNGASSFINANGTVNTGTVPATTLSNTLTVAGTFGGGGFGDGGLMEEWGLSFTAFSDQGHTTCLNASGYWNFTASC